MPYQEEAVKLLISPVVSRFRAIRRLDSHGNIFSWKIPVIFPLQCCWSQVRVPDAQWSWTNWNVGVSSRERFISQGGAYPDDGRLTLISNLSCWLAGVQGFFFFFFFFWCKVFRSKKVKWGESLQFQLPDKASDADFPAPSCDSMCQWWLWLIYVFLQSKPVNHDLVIP